MSIHKVFQQNKDLYSVIYLSTEAGAGVFVCELVFELQTVLTNLKP